MNRSQKIIITILSILAISLAIGLGIYSYQLYQSVAFQPLGPLLPAGAKDLPPTWTASPGPSPTSMGSVTLAPTVSFTTNTPAPRCNGPALMNVLVVGADTRGDNYTYGLADAIRVVRVDFITPKVTVLEFPRDLWVEIPHIEDNLDGQDHEKLNQAFLYGQPGFKYWDDPSEGSGLLALTLNKNFGVQIDHYITVNMRTFVNIVNAVGGIDVNIPDKETSRTADLPVGENHLSGAEALKLVRNREGGTFERADNQSLVICALRKKLTSPSVVTQIPELIESFQDNVRTDFTPEQLSQLACLGTQMPPQNIQLVSFPSEHFKQTRTFDPVFDKRISILDADFDILREYVAQFQAGTWPTTSSDLTDEETEEDTPIICE
ncbi:MAG: LCP family protein [Anaerolineales bacterium]|nr:LCP family protein [Anaerolineales bacterium]